MTRKPITALAVSASLALVFSLAAMSGCRPSCESIPTEGLANVRILNAVSNSPLLLVYVDGKLFDSCWYDVANKYYKWNHNHVFGYRTTFLSDGSGLRTGLHHIAAMDATSRDTVATWDGILSGYKQSMIFPGKMNGSALQTPQDNENPDRRTRIFNDITRNPEARSFARFFDAVPDIGGESAEGLDVYFNDTPTIVSGNAKPDLRIRFDSISRSNGLDDGTGNDSNDYVEFPLTVPGLLIMPVGNTDVNDAILNVPYSFVSNGLLFTIVIRGETDPTCNDPAASVILLEDGQNSQGSFSTEIESFYVRLVNASRDTNLSLLIKGEFDASPRAGIPAGAGEQVLNLGTDSVGEYLPLSPTYDEDSHYYFSTTTDTNNIVFQFYENDSANTRWTYIAIDTIRDNTGTPGIDTMILADTVCNPTNTNNGRVRFVNTSPDYTATFTFAGKSFTMKQRSVMFADTAVGNYSIPLSGGSASTTMTIPVDNQTPTTVFFMPSNPSNPLPYHISTQ
jgi:hypothetical protein